MNLYRLRFRVYTALLLCFIAMFLIPTPFMVIIVGFGIEIYFPMSLLQWFLGTFVESYRDVKKLRSTLGISTPIFCMGFVIAGCCMAVTYVFSDSVVIPQLGIVFSLFGVDYYLMYHEANVRAIKQQYETRGAG